MTTSFEDMTPEEKLERSKAFAITELSSGVSQVGKSIDKLTSASLKRVLKTVSHVHAAEDALGRPKLELSEDEQKLIDRIFALQESLLGFVTLLNEAQQEEEHPFVQKGE